MDIERFWSIIEPIKDDPNPEETIRPALETLRPEELVAFQRHFDTLFAQAYHWDVWGAAYTMNGGCSDDGFTDFRYALISKGRATYDAALANADTLAPVEIEPNESFGYVPQEVYEEKTGEEQMPREGLAHRAEPEGDDWDFDDDAECARRLPRVWERYG